VIELQEAFVVVLSCAIKGLFALGEKLRMNMSSWCMSVADRLHKEKPLVYTRYIVDLVAASNEILVRYSCLEFEGYVLRHFRPQDKGDRQEDVELVEEVFQRWYAALLKYKVKHAPVDLDALKQRCLKHFLSSYATWRYLVPKDQFGSGDPDTKNVRKVVSKETPEPLNVVVSIAHGEVASVESNRTTDEGLNVVILDYDLECYDPETAVWVDTVEKRPTQMVVFQDAVSGHTTHVISQAPTWVTQVLNGFHCQNFVTLKEARECLGITE